MTRKKALELDDDTFNEMNIVSIKHFEAYEKVINEIYDDFESRTCEGCVDYVGGVCQDSKGHYCVRGSSMEDRYVKGGR